MPTYSQAIREIILGRVESVEEKKRRIVTRICNVYRKPAFKKYFEESFIDSLKSVREATNMTHKLCPDKGLFFKVSISSLIDMSALFSLSIHDLCDYANLTIRIRCYEIIDSVRHTKTQQDGSEDKAIPGTSLSEPRSYVVPTDEAIDNKSTLRAGRPMSVSRRGSLQRVEEEKCVDDMTLGRENFEQFVHPDSCRVVMEVSLHSFYEGLVVLRALFSIIRPLSICIAASRATIANIGDEFYSAEDCDMEITRIIVSLVHSISTLGDNAQDAAVNVDHMDLNTCLGLFEIYKPGIAALRHALNDAGVNGDAFFKRCHQQCAESSDDSQVNELGLCRKFISLVLCEVERIVFEAILSCFESTENLVMEGTTLFEGSKGGCINDQKVVSIVSSLLENWQNKMGMLSEKRDKIDHAVDVLRLPDERSSLEDSETLQKVNNDAGNVFLDELAHETALTPEIVERSSNDLCTGNDYIGGESTEDESVFISEEDREGADDWTVHYDEGTGYWYIYSAVLDESRWLNVN